MKLRLFVGFSVMICAQVFAQLTYRFKNFTISEGLSQSSVTAISQDNKGALWIGTQDGINLFDGKAFQTFTSDDTPGIENGNITTIFNDSKGAIWFGSGNGLIRYNESKESWKTFKQKSKSYLSIDGIDELKDERLVFVSSSQGLFYFDKKKTTITTENKFPSKKISFVKSFGGNKILLSTTDKGVQIFDVKTKKTFQIAKTKEGWEIKDATLFRKGIYLLATNQGLWLLNEKNWKLTPFLKKVTDKLEINEFVNVEINQEGDIYLATLSKGLLTAKKNGFFYQVYQSKQDNLQKFSLLYNELRTLFKDKSGTIWVGSLRGLSAFNPSNQGFFGIGPSEDLSTGLPSDSVWGFAEDENGEYVYVATDFYISRIDRKTGEFTHFSISKAASSPETSILSVFYVSNQQLLIGCTDGLYSLQIFSSNSYKIKKLSFGKEIKTTVFERIYDVIPLNSAEYAIATNGGVLIYNIQSAKSIELVHNSKKLKQSIASGLCRLAFQGVDKTVYFPTSTGGLNYLKQIDGKRVIVPHPLNNKILSASKDFISCMYQVKSSEIWLGTSGSGLLKLNLNNGKIKRFTRREGLPNNFIYGIAPDERGNIWVSTNKGLSLLNIKSELCSNYLDVDGLMSNEFNTGAYMRSQTGELFFGGILGYNFFTPEKLYKGQNDVTLHFSKFKVKDKWLKPGEKGTPFQTSVSSLSKIQLKYNQRSFSFSFIPSDVLNSNLIQYKYILRGSDEPEVFLGNTNEVHFNSLPPGLYTLDVYGRISDGEWSSKPASMQIEIYTPFWGKWWFWSLIVVAMALFIRWFIRKRVDLARRDQVRLEMKIVERTKEIRSQNEQIQEQRRIIEEEKNKVEEQSRLLQIEKDKTERLLNNVIPQETANELKASGKASARAYKKASVLFTDFVGFTTIAEGLKPSELVRKLDIYFSKFDEIINNNNLEKIKTIGDAYMCAGGLPLRNDTNPTDAVLAGLQIQAYMERLKNDAIANGFDYWELRLGINTGEVTAGVIGTTRYAYDVWGATVNQAQRMEMTGSPGKVNISGATFLLIEPYFECTYRGKVLSKSKGKIDIFTVERLKPELSLDDDGTVPNERFVEIQNLHLFSSINYMKAERHIMKVLQKGLKSHLHYHSIDHTKDVVRAVERYALMEGVTDDALFLLKTAATYHDAGFVKQYDHNEAIGAEMAEQILPKYGYTNNDIERIKELIFVTEIPHKPKNLLEQIICDADLDYLGRDDFHVIADRLRKELKEQGKIDSDRKWDEIQVSFLSNHTYFTKTAHTSREAKKQLNIQEVKSRLLENNYED